MSVQKPSSRITAPEIFARKGGAPIVALTSYHAHTAAIADRHVDFILVGDSLGMVMHGFETTLPVPLDLMIMHAQAVVRGSTRALVVVDMPFGSYEASKEQAFHSAVRILKETHCGAVKLEGGVRMAETVAFLVGRGVPVMGHIGLTPQSINTLGSFRAQGRDEGSWDPILRDAQAISEAGAFSVVVEAVEAKLEHNPRLSPAEATKLAMAEITAPIIAITLVLLSVFVPVAFVPGISGQLYQQFAVAVAVSMVISAVNALTLSPALCGILLKHHAGPKRGPMRYVLGAIDWARDGSLAEYAAVEARNLAPLPADVDHTVAAALPISGLTACRASSSTPA